MNGPSEAFPATTQSRPANREEPEKIKKWREEQQKMLEIKGKTLLCLIFKFTFETSTFF